MASETNMPNCPKRLDQGAPMNEADALLSSDESPNLPACAVDASAPEGLLENPESMDSKRSTKPPGLTHFGFDL